NVAEDHQTKNALALVEREAAVLVEDGQASQEMIQRATDLLAAPERKRTLEQNIRQLARPNAAERIAREVLALIGGAEAEER
ncbi:MAG: UDP-N-acetylglucosamine--N-acetylmuramyl-(pentapeptide) pyrophosphoryl-undecaprenol N-acetylglucosamine transferase, partial [Bacteroidota bacterium]